MRRQSLCLVMAANQNLGIDVFFGAEFNFRVQIPDFCQAHHYKISKNLFTSSQHQKGLFTRACLRPAGSSPREIFCMFWRPALRPRCLQVNKSRIVQKQAFKTSRERAFKTNQKKSSSDPSSYSECYFITDV